MLLQSLHAANLSQIAYLWAPMYKEGCTIYVIADPDKDFGIRDDFSFHQVSSIFPSPLPNRPGKIDVIPIKPNMAAPPPLQDGHLIIIGRSHTYGYPELVNALSPQIHDYARYRFLDNQKMLDRISGRLYMREELRDKKRGYGVLRYWYDQEKSRYIMHFTGAGALATFATTLTMTKFLGNEAETGGPDNQEVTRSIPYQTNNKLEGLCREKGLDLSQSGGFAGLLELPVVVNWDADNGDISADTVQVTHLEPNYSNDKDDIVSRLPWIEFKKRVTKSGVEWAVYVGAPDKKAKLLTKNQAQAAILAAIADRTANNPSMAIEKKGYITYTEIIESPVAAAVYSSGKMNLNADLVRVNIGRIKQRLKNTEWWTFCPNLLLHGAKDGGQTKRRKEIVYRHRGNLKGKLPE